MTTLSFTIGTNSFQNNDLLEKDVRRSVRVVGRPVGVAGFAPVKIAVRVRPGRHTHQHRGDSVGPQARKRETLLSAHAATRQHYRLAIPVGPSRSEERRVGKDSITPLYS